MDKFEAALAELGLSFPEPTMPVANYVPYVVAGNMVYVSGQIPFVSGEIKFVGKLGRDYSIEEGQQAARICGLNILGLIRHACGGNLERVIRCVKLGAFINGNDDFTDQSEVANGASDLMVAVFGERGRHARAAVGVNSLPRGVAVEVEAVFEIER